MQAARAISFCSNPAVEAFRGPTPEEAQKRDAQWGNGRGESGHRAAFCIPLIVPRSIAYNIFERHTFHGCRYDCFTVALRKFGTLCLWSVMSLKSVRARLWVQMCVCLRPDLAERTVKDSAGQECPIKLGPKLWVSFFLC